MRPSSSRLSGTKAMPAWRASLTDDLVMSWPSSFIEPVTCSCNPTIDSANSDWPFPCTPATAKISPAQTSNETFFTSERPV